jgi:DNA replication protein DnaD
MKTKEHKIKEFDTVKTFRKIKTQISKEIKDMNLEQLQKYLEEHRLRPEA